MEILGMIGGCERYGRIVIFGMLHKYHILGLLEIHNLY